MEPLKLLVKILLTSGNGYASHDLSTTGVKRAFVAVNVRRVVIVLRLVPAVLVTRTPRHSSQGMKCL